MTIERLLMLAPIGAKGFKGGIAVVGPDGYTITGKAGPGFVRVGAFHEDFDNTLGVAPLAVNIELDQEIKCKWYYNDVVAPIVQADVLRRAFVLDDQTVTADSGNSIAGRVWRIDAKQGVLVQTTFEAADNQDTSQTVIHDLRAVITSIAAYTAAAGVLTANANGALAAQDGVATLAVGDMLLLPTDKAAAAKDAGPYIITALGGAAAKFVLTRPDWYRTGSTQPSGQMITVRGEGTARGGSEWKSLVATPTFVVDTTDGAFYPRFESVVTGAMVAGVSPANNTIYVAANAQFNPIPQAPAGAQGIYRMSTSTPGKPTVSSLVVTSSSATETSTVKIQVVNF